MQLTNSILSLCARCIALWNPQGKNRRSKFRLVSFVVAFAVVGLVFMFFNIVLDNNWGYYDSLMRVRGGMEWAYSTPKSSSSDVVLVEIDDEADAELSKNGIRPFPMTDRAWVEVLGKLERDYSPKAIVVEPILADQLPDAAKEDPCPKGVEFRSLTCLARERPNLYFSYARLPTKNDADSEIRASMLSCQRHPAGAALISDKAEKTIAVSLPFFALNRHGGKGHLPLADRLGMVPNDAGLIRAYPAFSDENGCRLPSLPMRVVSAMKAGKSTGRMPDPDTAEILLNWRPGSPSPAAVSCQEATKLKPFAKMRLSSLLLHDLRSRPTSECLGLLAGKIIVVGHASAQTSRMTNAGEKYSPGEVLATAIDNLMKDDWIGNPGDGPVWVITLLVAVWLLWDQGKAYLKNGDMTRSKWRQTYLGTLAAFVVILFASVLMMWVGHWYFEIMKYVSVGALPLAFLAGLRFIRRQTQKEIARLSVRNRFNRARTAGQKFALTLAAIALPLGKSDRSRESHHETIVYRLAQELEDKTDVADKGAEPGESIVAPTYEVEDLLVSCSEPSPLAAPMANLLMIWMITEVASEIKPDERCGYAHAHAEELEKRVRSLCGSVIFNNQTPNEKLAMAYFTINIQGLDDGAEREHRDSLASKVLGDLLSKKGSVA